MESKHTPGPWYYTRYDSVEPYGKFAICKQGERSVATTTGGALSDLANENEANARLIAAAPDLLEILIALTAAFDSGDLVWKNFESKHYGCHGDARAAIAKAKGK